MRGEVMGGGGKGGGEDRGGGGGKDAVGDREGEATKMGEC